MNTRSKYPVADISEIDWNDVIKNKKDANPEPVKNGSEFWNRRAPSFADHAGKTFYPDSFLNILNPEPSWTVFDMGCGAGTLAIPLANRVKHITAVDFSDKMLEILRGEADRRGLSNIETIKASWTDDWDAAGIGVYDVAIASRSLAVNDIHSALTRLDNAARKRVIISTVVGDGPFDRMMFNAVGRDRAESIDYIYFYNLLYQMGILASISFIVEESDKRFGSHEEACESVKWMFQEMTPQEEGRLKRYMEEHLAEEKGWLRLDYRKISRWAIIWWDKEF